MQIRNVYLPILILIVTKVVSDLQMYRELNVSNKINAHTPGNVLKNDEVSIKTIIFYYIDTKLCTCQLAMLTQCGCLFPESC